MHTAALLDPALRPLGPRDASAYGEHLLRLTERDRWLLFGGPFGPAFVRSYAAACFGGTGAVAFGAWEGGLLSAAALAVLSGGTAEITLSVEPGLRRRGVGRALLRRAGDVAALLGCARGAVRLAPDATEMRALALSCGATLKREGCLALLPLPLP